MPPHAAAVSGCEALQAGYRYRSRRHRDRPGVNDDNAVREERIFAAGLRPQFVQETPRRMPRRAYLGVNSSLSFVGSTLPHETSLFEADAERLRAAMVFRQRRLVA